jgi:hypothetical protein
MVTNGDVMGCSGILNNTICQPVKSIRESANHWRWVYIAGKQQTNKNSLLSLPKHSTLHLNNFQASAPRSTSTFTIFRLLLYEMIEAEMQMYRSQARWPTFWVACLLVLVLELAMVALQDTEFVVSVALVLAVWSLPVFSRA